MRVLTEVNPTLKSKATMSTSDNTVVEAAASTAACGAASQAAAEESSCCSADTQESMPPLALCNQVWAVWQQHAVTLRRFVQQRTREHMLTDDLLSEVLLRTYKNCEKLAEVRDVQAWLTRIAQNALTDHYRKKQLNKLSTADTLAATPEQELPEQRLAACLGEMLLLLPETDRQALQWADLEGLPQEVVAQRLQLSLSGAKSRIQRARKKLRQELEACCHVETDRQGRISGYSPKRSC